jgi:16S rRNA (guanine966-N2)-methyltransferase
MRVISGTAKGRRLRAASSARPTTDMVKQSIFDMLGSAPRDAEVLDLFAGSGAFGIEALSRGAHEATFVDSDRDACSVTLANLETTGLRSQALIKRSDALRFLSKTPSSPFDLAFLDPPYERGLGFVARVLEALAVGRWIRQGGTVVAEAPVGPIEWPAGFRETRARRFGRTHVSMAVWDGAPGDLPGDV